MHTLPPPLEDPHARPCTKSLRRMAYCAIPRRPFGSTRGYSDRRISAQAKPVADKVVWSCRRAGHRRGRQWSVAAGKGRRKAGEARCARPAGVRSTTSLTRPSPRAARSRGASGKKDAVVLGKRSCGDGGEPGQQWLKKNHGPAERGQRLRKGRQRGSDEEPGRPYWSSMVRATRALWIWSRSEPICYSNCLRIEKNLTNIIAGESESHRIW